ncbi:MAG: hypothetical protein Kow0062_12150 [Acidobacteriota bacterium]
MIDRLPPGKVPWDLVARHVSGPLPENVELGPGPGEDAALVRFGDALWAVASDPISFTAEQAGRLAVLVNANDVAVAGARPALFVAVLLVAPSEATPERIDRLLAEIRAACDELGVALIGGHTEVSPGLEHSVVVGTMLGPVEGRPLRTGGLAPGCRVSLAGWAGLEGSGVLLDEFGEALAGRIPAVELDALRAALAEHGISIVGPARAAAGVDGVVALHDVTEGGVGEALYEMARASGVTIEARPEAVPVLPATRRIAGLLSIDPAGLLGSGALLVGHEPDAADALARAVGALGLPFAEIGAVTGPAPEGSVSGLRRFPRDEVLRALALRGAAAWVFDMDGTLVDSPYDWTAIRRRLDVRSPSIIDDIEQRPEPGRTRAWQELRRIENHATERATAMPGARELLDLLRRHGVRTALVTNNSRANAEALLERFDLRFDLVITRDDGVWKPSPAPIERALDGLGVDPSRAVVVGDSRYDLEAGRTAGVRAVVILGPPDGEAGRQADLCFPDLDALARHAELCLDEGNAR